MTRPSSGGSNCSTSGRVSSSEEVTGSWSVSSKGMSNLASGSNPTGGRTTVSTRFTTSGVSRGSGAFSISEGCGIGAVSWSSGPFLPWREVLAVVEISSAAGESEFIRFCTVKPIPMTAPSRSTRELGLREVCVCVRLARGAIFSGALTGAAVFDSVLLRGGTILLGDAAFIGALCKWTVEPPISNLDPLGKGADP